jgi:hypothetical protein
MHIPRLLVVLLLISLFAAPVAAQSSRGKVPVSSQPQLAGLVAPQEFHAQDSPPEFRQRLHTPDFHVLPPTVAQNDGACYTMRSYRVTRDDPGSDATRLAGYSECQAAARFQVKSAVGAREIVPR